MDIDDATKHTLARAGYVWVWGMGGERGVARRGVRRMWGVGGMPDCGGYIVPFIGQPRHGRSRCSEQYLHAYH